MAGLSATRERILDVAVDVLGAAPEAGMADVAAAAGVVRRTVYGYFPTRAELVLALARRAADEMTAILDEEAGEAGEPAGPRPADAAWVGFVVRLWPVAQRYRVLLVLRRGEFGAEIHALLDPVEEALTRLIDRGQREARFAAHLPAAVLAQVAWSALFTIADGDVPRGTLDPIDVVRASLSILGVSDARADELLAP